MVRRIQSTLIILILCWETIFAQDYRDPFVGTYLGTYGFNGQPCTFNDTIYIQKGLSSNDLTLRFCCFHNPNNISISGYRVFSDSFFTITNGCFTGNTHDPPFMGYFFKYHLSNINDISTGYPYYQSTFDTNTRPSPDTLTYYHPTDTFIYRFVRISNTTPYDTLISITSPTYSKLKLYPQPAQNELFVSDLPQGKKVLKLFDLVGKEIWRKESELVEEVIDLSALQNGMYVLEVECEGKRFTEKVLKGL